MYMDMVKHGTHSFATQFMLCAYVYYIPKFVYLYIHMYLPTTTIYREKCNVGQEIRQGLRPLYKTTSCRQSLIRNEHFAAQFTDHFVSSPDRRRRRIDMGFFVRKFQIFRSIESPLGSDFVSSFTHFFADDDHHGRVDVRSVGSMLELSCCCWSQLFNIYAKKNLTLLTHTHTRANAPVSNPHTDTLKLKTEPSADSMREQIYIRSHDLFYVRARAYALFSKHMVRVCVCVCAFQCASLSV